MANLGLLERIERGREARVLLDHPLLQEAFAGVESGIVEQWKAQPDAVSRETLWAGLHGARRVETFLKAMADDGQMAQHEAAQQDKP